MTHIEQIVGLKNLDISKSKRGYLFESLIREIQPWDKRPPIVMSPKSEQLDGVFEYGSNLFIIESKAVDKVITPGSKEWEDYELKLRKRAGKGIIGLFCCLNDVSRDLIDQANSLNREGFPNILIYGENWIQLNTSNFEFCNFIDFMVLNARVKRISSVENLNSAKKWYYDKNLINNHFKTICEKHSAIFIRRFKHENHESIFVKRKISDTINSHIELFRPSILKKTKNNSLEQIIILRDLSGSGKTTSAIDYLVETDFSYCFGFSANQISFDVFFEELLSKIEYSDFGLRELTAVDKPIVFIIDSLDEVKKSEQHQKRKEIYALVRRINELNKIAENQKLTKFPILVLFTLRDDYWEDWDESFEGREVLELKNRQTLFTEKELNEAIAKYSSVYHYRIENKLSMDCRQILSVPINMEIFSQANSYSGDIKVSGIWEGEILSSYFKRKYEDIQGKHYLENFSESDFLGILTQIANHIILKKELTFERVQLIESIEQTNSHLCVFAEDILKLFVSDQIIINNPKIENSLRFKYTRFVEYLIALYILEKVSNEKKLEVLEDFILSIYDSHIVDTHTVLKNIRTICRKNKYRSIGKRIMDYYQTSEIYLNSFLPKLRCEISLGKVTGGDEIKELISKTYSQSPQINSDVFYIISARNNNQSDDHIISSFISAWEANSSEAFKTNRWRLVDKLSNRFALLLNETIVNILLNDSIYKDWEVYFGKILEATSNQRDEFYEFWHQIDATNILSKYINKDPKEWIYVSRLLSIILENKKYIIGDLLNEDLKDNEYITFEKKRNYSFAKDKKNNIDDFINYLISLMSSEEHIHLLYSNRAMQLSSAEEISYLNDEFEEKIEKRYNASNHSFFNFLIENINQYNKLVHVIVMNSIIDISIELPSEKSKNTLLISLSNSAVSESHIYEILDYIYSKGYCKNKLDDKYFAEDKGKVSNLFYIIKSYYLIGDRNIGKKLRGYERILFTLYSLKMNTVVGFGFPQLISVANNAIQHYRSHSKIIINAMQLYGVFEEFMKKDSFKKKIENLVDIEQDESIKDAIKYIFPELL